MKKNILIGLVIVIIIAGVYLFTKQKKVVEVPVNTQTNVNNVQNTIQPIVLKNQKQIGDMVFGYPEDAKFDVNNSGILNMSINKIQKRLNFSTNKAFISNSTSLVFFFYKNANPEKLPIEKWFEQNNPEEEKQSPYSVISSEKIKINGEDALQVILHASPDVSGGYYNFSYTYISHNTDIYEIQNYKLPTKEDLDPALTPEDIKNSQDYEKIVDQIIKSIYFIK